MYASSYIKWWPIKCIMQCTVMSKNRISKNKMTICYLLCSAKQGQILLHFDNITVIMDQENELEGKKNDYKVNFLLDITNKWFEWEFRIKPNTKIFNTVNFMQSRAIITCYFATMTYNFEFLLYLLSNIKILDSILLSTNFIFESRMLKSDRRKAWIVADHI